VYEIQGHTWLHELDPSASARIDTNSPPRRDMPAILRVADDSLGDHEDACSGPSVSRM
jgi:hypothetical protein